jgi:hypothetical protein
MDSNVCRVMSDDSLSLFVQYVNCDRMNYTNRLQLDVCLLITVMYTQMCHRICG